MISRRLNDLPPYLAAAIAARTAELRRAGHPVIDLSVGSPDLAPDPRVIEAAERALRDPQGHGYVIGRGHPRFRSAVARYMERRFEVTVDPDQQVVALLGSKEGLAHLPIALCNPGEIGVHPDPGYPVYRPSLLLAGVRPLELKLDPGRNWRPDWEQLQADHQVIGATPVRQIVLNYPHNPTAACADLQDFDQAVRQTRRLGAVLINDNAYADIGFDGYRPPSLLQAPEAARGESGSGVVEFHSLSKTFSMAGWRCAFAVGDPEVISLLARVKSYYDTGLFAAVQCAAAVALDSAEEIAARVSDRYQKRRDLLQQALEPLGLQAAIPKATIYLWARIPEEGGGPGDDRAYCRRLLEEAHVALSPGSGYGRAGCGYVRLALTDPEEVLAEAVERLARWSPGR